MLRLTRSRSRGRLVAVAASCALALGATACGGGDDTETTTADTAASSSETTGDDAAASSETSSDAGTGETLNVMWGTPGGSNYDPHEAFNPFANVFLYPAYDRLTETNPEGEVVPMLAESWKFLEGDTVLRLNLRDGVTFHDGEPFNAEAVKANIERGQTLETSAVKQDLAIIEEVVVVDESTVDLKLSGPGAALPALLSDRAGMMVSPAAFDNEDLDLRPVGAGAFEVADHQPGASITFTAYDQYWDPEAQQVDAVEILMQLDPEARLRAMQDGTLDMTTINPDQISAAEGGDFAINNAPVAAAYLLYLNKTKPGLDDPLVREAISLGIDRAAIGESLHAGQCAPANQIYPATYWAGDPDLAVDPYDPEKARQLLEEAGMASGLSLSAVVVNVPFYIAQLEAIQAQMAEIGIELEVIALEPTELLSRFATGESDMYFSQWPGAVDPGKTAASLLGAESSLNPGGYTDPDIEKLTTDGLSVIEQSQRAPIYQDLSAKVADENFHIVVCNPQITFLTAPEVSGIVPTVGGSFDFRGVSVGG